MKAEHGPARLGPGFARGAWAAFNEELVPVARTYGAAGGDDALPARQVLLVDRAEAVRFLAAVAAGHARATGVAAAVGGGAGGPAVPEVTGESPRRLAYEIWERKGRVDGHYLDDGLEAEALLTAAAARRWAAGAGRVASARD